MAYKKIISKNKKIIIFLLVILYSLTTAVYAEEFKVIFNHLDAVGDDYGPGYYNYPENKIFQTENYLFDLKSLTIFENEKDYKLKFSFQNLVDPWGAKYEFSLPLIELYIDNQEGGSNKLFEDGANISFREDFFWDYFIKVSGFWLKSFTPDSKKKHLLNINDLRFSDFESTKKLKLNKEKNDLYLFISKEDIVFAENTKLIVLIGSFDPFGYGHFRALSQNKSYWQLYSKEKISEDKSPRVLDILIPGAKSQKEILKHNLAQIPYLTINKKTKEAPLTVVDHLMPVNKISLSIFFLYILIIILLIFKFKYKK